MYNKFTKCFALEDKYIHVEHKASYYLEWENVWDEDAQCFMPRKLTIYFEKSNGLTDWLNNFSFPAKPYRDMEDKWYCHRGFLKVWKSIEKEIAWHIMNTYAQEIDIIGYSHGGAIAQLCYEYVKFNRPDVKVTGVGFGSPRVLWGKVSDNVKARFEGFVVVRNGKDLVTHLPPAVFGFHHVAEVLKVGKCKGLTGVKDHYPERYMAGLLDE